MTSLLYASLRGENGFRQGESSTKKYVYTTHIHRYFGFWYKNIIYLFVIYICQIVV